MAPAYEDVVFLNDGEMFSSALIFGLRMCDGVDINSLKTRFPRADWQKYAEPIRLLREEGLIETGEKPSIIKLTRAGKLLADSVAVELL
ncbi:oxygen-independent coproporphyrinogen III oxidase [Coraliomargarita sp. CAG:312]|nr:oxygen-independent coproporphyrinogen III oxidase [Coraliomargarita sp. CAG:312]